MTNPLVSICIAAYNAGEYIEETVESLLTQSFDEIEVIVVDDGSQDDTPLKLSKIDDPRLSVYQQDNRGAGAARNQALSLSSGSFIKFMDADDLLSPSSIQHQVQLALSHPQCIISSKWGRFYNGDLNTFILSEEEVWQDMKGADWVLTSWLRGPNMTQPGIFLLPRELVVRTGVWEEELSKGPCDDMHYFTRAILNSKGVKFCDEATLFYRSGLNNSLSKRKGHESYAAFLETVLLSVEEFLSRQNNHLTRVACANQIQNFIYNCYPKYPDLLRTAEEALMNLNARPTYRFPCGGYTRFLVKAFGWRLACQIKERLKG